MKLHRLGSDGRFHWTEVKMLKRDGTQDWDAKHKVSEQLAVVRWGRDWFVLDTTTDSQLGPPWPRLIDARDHALERVARGDYK